MILVKGRLINEDQLLHVVDDDKNFCKSEGCTIHCINGKEFGPTDFKSADIYAAIENKNNLPKQQAAEIEALKKELKDTEDLYIKANQENEKLRLQIEKLTINIANAPGCEFALIGQDDLCIGNEECPSDCSRCGIYYKFCEPSIEDENGCQGIKEPSGFTHPKCHKCPDLHRTPTADPEEK